MTCARHILVTGRVQGVFFRASTQAKARELGVRGWVRNLRDGRVEIVAEGRLEELDELVRWCGSGPPAAIVADVQHGDIAVEGLEGFIVADTSRASLERGG